MKFNEYMSKKRPRGKQLVYRIFEIFDSYVRDGCYIPLPRALFMAYLCKDNRRVERVLKRHRIKYSGYVFQGENYNMRVVERAFKDLTYKVHALKIVYRPKAGKKFIFPRSGKRYVHYSLDEKYREGKDWIEWARQTDQYVLGELPDIMNIAGAHIYYNKELFGDLEPPQSFINSVKRYAAILKNCKKKYKLDNLTVVIHAR